MAMDRAERGDAFSESIARAREWVEGMQSANGGSAGAAANGATPATALQGTAYTTVLAMLRGWEKTDDATR